MSERTGADVDKEVSDWWRTEIIDMAPGEIRYRGYAIEDLIGNVSFAQMVWLMLRGELPSAEQAKLLEAALMAAVDHGPQAPSIAIARMAATCGVGLNNAMASALNVLGDVHGGAGEQAAELFHSIDAARQSGRSLADATRDVLDRFFAEGNRFVPGFGHRFHDIDPRAPRLLTLIDEAASRGEVAGHFADIGRAIEADIKSRKGRAIPMNIDGATAIVYAELGFPPALSRGLFCLSRSVGILAHSWEQMNQGGRNKGPMPRRLIWTHEGPEPRDLAKF